LPASLSLAAKKAPPDSSPGSAPRHQRASQVICGAGQCRSLAKQRNVCNHGLRLWLSRPPVRSLRQTVLGSTGWRHRRPPCSVTWYFQATNKTSN
jgi:hypothetical protein